MKKLILLLLLTLAGLNYSTEIDKTLNNLLNSKPVQKYVAAADNFVTQRGWDILVQHTIQNTLANTLKVISSTGTIPALENTQRLLEKNITIQLGNLPQVSKAGLTEQVTDKIRISAGDAGVNQQSLKSAGSIIKDLSLPILKSKISIVPTGRVDVVLFSTAESYSKALLSALISPAEVSVLAANTGGITVNSSVWIPLYNINGKAGLANVLTHEFTHVAFNQAGIGYKLPPWLNEGTSWYTGLAAQERVNQAQTKLEISLLRRSVLQAAKRGQLLPLSPQENGILQAPYNVQFQGYMATEALINQYGLDQFRSFLNQTTNFGLYQSFKNNFQMTIDYYESTFNESL